MDDLFGNDVYRPTGSCANVLNAAHGFADFWNAWPRGPRKVAKQQCLNKWAKYGCANNASAIVAHVEAMKRSESWQKGFIPMPLTYLNQARWEGEPLESIDTDSRAAVEALAQTNGLGRWDEIKEQWAGYKNRVLKACGIGKSA